MVGSFVGAAVGDMVGSCVGPAVGTIVGSCVGPAVGSMEGSCVGAGVGMLVGVAVGVAVGIAVTDFFDLEALFLDFEPFDFDDLEADLLNFDLENDLLVDFPFEDFDTDPVFRDAVLFGGDFEDFELFEDFFLALPFFETEVPFGGDFFEALFPTTPLDLDCGLFGVFGPLVLLEDLALLDLALFDLDLDLTLELFFDDDEDLASSTRMGGLA